LVSFTNDLLNLFSSTRPSKCPHKFPHQLKKFFLLKSVLHLLLPNDVSASFLTSLHIIGESPPFYPLPFTLSTTFLIFFSVPRFKLQNSFPTPIYTLSHTYPTKNLINSLRCHQLVINVTKVRHYIQRKQAVNLFFKKLLNCPDSLYICKKRGALVFIINKNNKLC